LKKRKDSALVNTGISLLKSLEKCRKSIALIWRSVH
jgi:hypothetical protein